MNTPTPRTSAAIIASGFQAVPEGFRAFAGNLERELTALTTERDQLRAEVERLKTCGITELAAINPSVLEYCKHWEARAERAEAEAERYRLVTLRQDAELATEREKLDWVFQNCKVEANDYTTGNRDVYYVHDREDLGVAMKEDAK